MNSTIARDTVAGSSLRAGWMLLALGALLRIVSFVTSVNAGGDAWARVALTAQWLQHPSFKMTYDVYPPGHFWLMGLLAVPFHDVTFAGRLLSLVLGVGSLYLVWRITDQLFGAQAGLFALAVMVFYSLHIGYSTTSSAEVSYIFFLLLAMYFFFSYYAGTRQLWRLAVSGLALSVSESIRYEAWVICLAMGLASLWLAWGAREELSLRGRLARVLAFGVTAGAWPVCMMLYCWRRFGDPVHQITDTHRRVGILLAKQGHSHAYELLLLPGVILLSLSVFAVTAAIYGLKKTFASRVSAAFVAIAFFFAAVQFYEIARGQVVGVARYSITLGVFLAILAGAGFAELGARIWPGQSGRALAVVMVLLAINLGVVFLVSETRNPLADRFATFAPRLHYIDRIRGVTAYLRQHLGQDDKIVFDDYNAESNILAAGSGLPLLYGNRAYVAGVKMPMSATEYLVTERPRFLVYSSQGVLEEFKELPAGCSESAPIGNVTYRCVYANTVYRVYELSYN